MERGKEGEREGGRGKEGEREGGSRERCQGENRTSFITTTTFIFEKSIKWRFQRYPYQ